MNITQQFLTPNPYSRPGMALNATHVAWHYVANPGSSAQANRNYFENQKSGGKYVSAHYIIGLDGEIIQCIPESEWSYCTNDANGWSISIECCHPDATGKFNDATEQSLVELTADILRRIGQDETHIIRHYDVTKKICPKYYVDHPEAYIAAKARVAELLGGQQSVAPQPSEVVAMVTANGVNVRQWPSTGSAILGKLNNGNLVKVVDDLDAGPWIGIAYNDGTAYIARQYTNCDNGTRVEAVAPAAPKYSSGTYTLTANVKVRTGPGTGNRQKSKSELTADGQKHANASGVLQSGTAVTVKETQQENGNWWGRIPSGWIALEYQGDKYVK